MRRVLLFSLIILSGLGMVTAVFAQLNPHLSNTPSSSSWTEYPAAGQSLLLEFVELDAAPVDGDFIFPLGENTPANDACATATEISFTGNPIGGTTNVTDKTQAVDDPELSCVWGSPSDARGYRSVWYKFVASQNGVVTIDTVSSNYDTVVGVFTGLCGTLTQVACNDDHAGLSSRVTFNIKQAETYYIEIVDWSASGAGQKTLNAFMQSEPIDSQWDIVHEGDSGQTTGAAVAAFGTAFYQFGGQESSGDISQSIHRFETTNNSWSNVGAILPQFKRYFSAARVGTRIYLPGGDTAVDKLDTSITDDHYAFDLGLNSSVTRADLPSPVAWSQSLAVPGDNNGYYVIGGFNDKWETYPTVGVSMTTNALNTVWRYNIGVNNWTTEPTTMLTPRFGHTAAYFDGQICVMGGLNSNLELLVSGECWTPGGSSGFINSTNIVRYGASSAVSPDGRWFIFGGLDSKQEPVSEVEVLHPGSSNWQLLDVSFDLGGTTSNNPRTRPNGGFVGYNLYAIGGSFTDSNLTPSVNFNVERLFSVGGETNYLPAISNQSNVTFDDNFSVARPIAVNTAQNGRFYESTDFYSFYRFDLTSFGSPTINLSGIPGSSNYDIFLFDDNKTLWGQSQNPGSNPDSITTALSPGRYYVMVQRIFGDHSSSIFNISVSN